MAIIAAVILIIIFDFWNHRLSRAIVLRKKIEKELRTSEEILRLSHQRLVLHREQNPLAVIEWNTNFEVVYWSESAEKMFGFKNEEVYYQHITKSILPESAKSVVDEVWDNLSKNKGGKRSSNENMTKDGCIV